MNAGIILDSGATERPIINEDRIDFVGVSYVHSSSVAPIKSILFWWSVNTHGTLALAYLPKMKL